MNAPAESARVDGFAPGPWKVGPYHHVVLPVGDKPDSYNDGSAICHVYGETRRAANARLIAAAPDLLAVVQELQASAAYWSEYDVPLGITDRINAALAKATGEGA